ncbi:MAG: hypothetical protein PF495_18015 [Spirochaetales bacterium]|jgi:hypothetical protein|nr:hypothetical protein [Spirochaetales bacterium]
MKKISFKKIVFAATVISLLILTNFSLLFAEGRLTGETSLINSLKFTKNSWTYAAGGSAELSYTSVGNANVKSEVTLQFRFPSPAIALDDGEPSSAVVIPLVSVKSASIKARFPSFRLTVGKTRVSWGDGFFFNAGDLIYGSTETDGIDLTTNELRTETAWLTAVQIPLGRFSFAEALVLPPAPDGRSNADGAAGVRFYTTLNSVKVEGGYLFAKNRRLYTALQGNIGPDWYGAAAVDLPGSSSTEDPLNLLQDSLSFSFGLFHLQKLNRIQSVTLRLEGLVRPWSSWSAQTTEHDYGIYLYPEISYTPADAVSISLRSLVSPVDLSAQITSGISWNILQGFTLMGYLTVNAGESSDIFAWEAVDLSLGVNYIY